MAEAGWQQTASRRLMRITLGSRDPLIHGVCTVRGLGESVTIRRDDWHVPHIEAASPADAWFGFGFCQGQDRAFQIELLARAAAGRLAELLGPSAIPVDRLARRLGLRRRAGAELRGLDADVRDAIQSFAAGVTAGATTGSPAPAHEFALLRRDPAPLTAADVLAMTKLNAFLLAGNWESELARLHVLVQDGEEALRALDPTYAEHLPVTAPVGRAAGPITDRLSEDLANLRAHHGLAGASNNWAVAATRTSTGRPLVANDPHLPPVLPPMWYLGHLTTPQWEVAGAALVGTPGITVGHNGFGAWGVTAAHTDNTDLFIEEIVGPGRVREREGEAAAEVRHEVIAVRGGGHVVEEVLETARGPIVSPALPDAPLALSIAATWLAGRPARGVLDLPAARGLDDLREAFRGWAGPQLNVVWGDVTGTIGWQLVGDLPVRESTRGASLPQPAWAPGVGWTGDYVGVDDLPAVADPALGFVATANNRPVPESADGPFLGIDYLEGYRAAAIIDGLEGRDDWDVAATCEFQQDHRSLPWLELRPALLDVPLTDPDTAVGHGLMAAWAGRVEPNSAAASVYELTLARLVERVVRAKAPKSAEWLLGAPHHDLAAHSILALRRTSHLVELLRSRPEGWFDEPWPDVVAAAVGDAVRQLRAAHGNDPTDWGWGRVRPVTLRHLASREVPALAPVLDIGPLAIGGDAHTVEQASVGPLHPTGDPVAIASLRMVVDVGEWSASRWVLPGGQSGNPLSDHYRDMVEPWLAGTGVPIPWAPDEVRDATVGTLRLIPHR